jgi:hypothetical protein
MKKLCIHFYFDWSWVMGCHNIQTDSGVYTASWPMGTGVSFPGGRAGSTWSRLIISSSAKVKNVWSYMAILPYIFMVWCIVKSTWTSLPFFTLITFGWQKISYSKLKITESIIYIYALSSSTIKNFCKYKLLLFLNSNLKCHCWYFNIPSSI